jgi:hypothetical protein
LNVPTSSWMAVTPWNCPCGGAPPGIEECGAIICASKDCEWLLGATPGFSERLLEG